MVLLLCESIIGSYRSLYLFVEREPSLFQKKQSYIKYPSHIFSFYILELKLKVEGRLPPFLQWPLEVYRGVTASDIYIYTQKHM